MNQQSIGKSELLRSLGYGGPTEGMDVLLEQAGLSRATKTAIHVGKREAVAALLAQNFILHCGRGDCRQRARDIAAERLPHIASKPEFCEVCGGSAALQALEDMCHACEAVGWSRICVVGGSPAAREQLWDGIGRRLALRLIDGTESRTRKQALVDMSWADHVVIWAGTQLHHCVSRLYGGAKVSAVANRGVQSLARHVVAVAGAQAK